MKETAKEVTNNENDDEIVESSASVYAWIVPLWADQLLPQLLMEQFDTLPIQCRHIEHMHGGVYNFCLHRYMKNGSDH